MRINKYLSLALGNSRRQADQLINAGRVSVDSILAEIGQAVVSNQKVRLDNRELSLPKSLTTVILNKPPGYVVSRKGQGSKTIYNLLPIKYHDLKPVGRLDKESSGLLLLTNDGHLAQKLTHPSSNKVKMYQVTLNMKLSASQIQTITEHGIKLSDGLSRFNIKLINGSTYMVYLTEGRNRQIRRTLEAVGVEVTYLHRLQFGNYSLDKLGSAKYKVVEP